MTSRREYLRLHLDNLLQYWSRGDAYFASGINRIVIYYAAWLTVRFHLAIVGFDPGSDRGIAAWLALHPAGLWQPHGLARLLIVPPAAALVWILGWIAMATTLAAIVGLGGRIATVVSALTLALLVALTLSWQPYWSHGFNILCLVPLAFMWNGAPSLSADEWLRKLFTKRPAPSYPLWPSLLAQAAIALFLFAAFYAKLGFLRHTITLDWIFSDNLRNAVTMPYALRGYPMPWWIRELVSHPALYIGAAAAHMVMQGFPICAIFTRSPYWRLAEGAMFFLGTALLYFVMTLGVGEWFLLCAVFVDWDYFILKARPALAATSANIRFWRAPPSYYALGFVALFAIVAGTKSSWSNGFYPFSPMDFYSTVDDAVTFPERVVARSFVHRPFHYFMDREVTHHRAGYANVYRANFSSVCDYVAPQADDASKIALTVSRYKTIMADSGKLPPLSAMVDPWAPWRYIPLSVPRFVERGTTDLQLRCIVYSIPAYPADPLPGRPLYTRLVSEYDAAHGRVQLASGTLDLKRQTITVRTYGFDRPKVALFYSPDPELSDKPVPMRAMPGHWIGAGTFVPVKVNHDAWFTTVEVTDKAGKRYDFWGPYLYSDFNDKP